MAIQSLGVHAATRNRADVKVLCVDRRGFILALALVVAACYGNGVGWERSNDVLILDDFTRDDLISALGTPWRGFSDQVMGGISQETIALTEIDGRRCLKLTGDVRLENSGGFIQMALDLAPEGQTLNASDYRGLLLVARGNGESYGVHLRRPPPAAPRPRRHRPSLPCRPRRQRGRSLRLTRAAGGADKAAARRRPRKPRRPRRAGDLPQRGQRLLRPAHEGPRPA
jgi:hypothetical protein